MPRHSVRRVGGTIRKTFRKKKYFDIEKDILETLYPHPYITEIVNSYETDVPSYNGHITLPDYGMCDLYNWVEAYEGQTSLQTTYTIIKKVVIALHYASLFNIYHRDIKLENIMVDETGVVKLIDWELCTKERYSREKVGTLGYMAPEVMEGNRYNCTKADMWSLGVSMFALYYGKRPYDDVPEVARYSTSKRWYCRWLKLIEGNHWSAFWYNHDKHSPRKAHPEFKNCIEGLLCYDPEHRTSLEELMECDLLNKPLLSRENLKEKALMTRI